MRPRPDVVPHLAPGISREYLIQYRVCPTGLAPDGHLIVATASDAPPEALDDLALAYGRAVVAQSTSAEELERLIERVATREERVGFWGLPI